MKLLPCPFCGLVAPEPDPTDGYIGDAHWAVDENHLSPRMDKPGTGALVSVEIRHWCNGDRVRRRIVITGRDHEDAERQWNERAP